MSSKGEYLVWFQPALYQLEKGIIQQRNLPFIQHKRRLRFITVVQNFMLIYNGRIAYGALEILGS